MHQSYTICNCAHSRSVFICYHRSSGHHQNHCNGYSVCNITSTFCHDTKCQTFRINLSQNLLLQHALFLRNWTKHTWGKWCVDHSCRLFRGVTHAEFFSGYMFVVCSAALLLGIINQRHCKLIRNYNLRVLTITYSFEFAFSFTDWSWADNRGLRSHEFPIIYNNKQRNVFMQSKARIITFLSGYGFLKMNYSQLHIVQSHVRTYLQLQKDYLFQFVLSKKRQVLAMYDILINNC